MKVLTAGIDTLYIGFNIERYREGVNFDSLTEAKLRASEKYFDSKGAPVNWYNIDFVVPPRGTQGYEWVLKNDDITVCINPEALNGRVMPEVYIIFSSQYLWSQGYEKAFKQARDWLDTWTICNDNKVSRCDLCMDIEMPMPIVDIEKEMVTRAKHRAEYPYTVPDVVSHYRGRHIATYTIGSGNLLARIYDKTTEISVHHKEWFRDIWERQGWNKEESVIRVEFQCRRESLKEHSTNSFGDFQYTLASIWHYCTHDWLRICNPGSKSNQKRWKEKDYWKLIQNSSDMFGEMYDIPRIKVKNANYDRLMKQVQGLLASACSLRTYELGVGGAIAEMVIDIREMLHSLEFRSDLKKRIARFGNMEKPDNYLVDEVIKCGGVVERVVDKGRESSLVKGSGRIYPYQRPLM